MVPKISESSLPLSFFLFPYHHHNPFSHHRQASIQPSRDFSPLSSPSITSTMPDAELLKWRLAHLARLPPSMPVPETSTSGVPPVNTSDSSKVPGTAASEVPPVMTELSSLRKVCYTKPLSSSYANIVSRDQHQWILSSFSTNSCKLRTPFCSACDLSSTIIDACSSTNGSTPWRT